MNCKQLKEVFLEEILAKLGHLPSKQNEKEAWFLNPFGKETRASFKLDKRKNRWFLFSEYIGGDTIDFVRKYFNCSITEALDWASKQDFSSFHQQILVKNRLNYRIVEVLEIQNWSLKTLYRPKRGLSKKIYSYVREVRFEMNEKKFYAIGFQNRSGGWELRNSFYKGGLLKKDLSIITNNSSVVCLFEGFIDALSYIEITDKLQEDILVLNSIALLDRVNTELEKYEKIHLYFDNDRAGEKAKKKLLNSFRQAKDYSMLYRDYKDFNEFVVAKKNKLHNKV